MTDLDTSIPEPDREHFERMLRQRQDLWDALQRLFSSVYSKLIRSSETVRMPVGDVYVTTRAAGEVLLWSSHAGACETLEGIPDGMLEHLSGESMKGDEDPTSVALYLGVSACVNLIGSAFPLLESLLACMPPHATEMAIRGIANAQFLEDETKQ